MILYAFLIVKYFVLFKRFFKIIFKKAPPPPRENSSLGLPWVFHGWVSAVAWNPNYVPYTVS